MNPASGDRLRAEQREATSRWGVLIASGSLALLAVLFYAPILTGLRTFPDGDLTHHFLPFSQYMAEAWRALTPPLWNPYTYSGHPFWADVQAAVLYPVSNLLLLVTLPFTSDSARLYLLEVEAVLHVFMAGLFTFVLARELTARVWPALLAGIAFMFSGYLTGYPPLQLAVLRTAVWLPLLLWLLLRAWRQPELWRYWIGTAFILAMTFYAGHTQTWMYVAYAVAGWIVVLALGSRADSGSPRHAFTVYRFGGVAVFVLLAAGLVSAQLLPSVEFSRLTVRAKVDYAFVSGGFPLQDTWQLLLPGVLTHFSPLYVGVIPLGLAVFGAISGLRRTSQPADPSNGELHSVRFRPYALGYFVVLALFGLLASYGDNGFLYPLLYRVAPGWSIFRGQERAAYLVVFGLSMLSAFGLAHVPAASRRFRRRYALVYGVLVTACVYTFGLLWQLPGRTAISQWHYLAIAAVTLLFAMSLAVTIWLDGWSVRREWLICAFAAATLVLANMTTNLANRSLAEAVAPPAEVEALQTAMDSTAGTTGLNGRVYNEFRVFEDYGMSAGVEDVWGSSPLRLSAYAALFENFPLDRMFRLTGVDHLLTWRKELFEPSMVLEEYPQDDDSTYLHELSEPNPRLWVVGSLIGADDEDAVILLADHGFDLDLTGVMPLESGVGAWNIDTTGARVVASRPNANELVVDVADSGGGVLMVSENWMPGWRVDEIECSQAIDCMPGIEHTSGLPMLSPVRANLSFLAIALPDGDVRFRLIYAPDSVRIGTLISAATLLVIVLGSVLRVAVTRRGMAI